MDTEIWNGKMKDCLKKMKCKICGYVYDYSKGDKRYFIKPYTPFELLPDDWKCPVCKYPKSAFYKKIDD